MSRTAVEVGPRLTAFVLPGIPESVRVARSRVRAALGFHHLDQYASDAAIITSELFFSNVIQHVCGDGAETVGVTLVHGRNPEAVTVIVSDSSPKGPAMRRAPAGSERGRGLRIVEALSAHWGWYPEDGGKAIFAILAKGPGA